MAQLDEFITELRQVYFSHEKNLYEFHKKFFDDYHDLMNSINKRSTAKKLIAIEENEEYSKDTFFTIQCVKSNDAECIIETDLGDIEFPAGSFFKGALYPINVLSLKQSGGAKFIGYSS